MYSTTYVNGQGGPQLNYYPDNGRVIDNSGPPNSEAITTGTRSSKSEVVNITSNNSGSTELPKASDTSFRGTIVNKIFDINCKVEPSHSTQNQTVRIITSSM